MTAIAYHAPQQFRGTFCQVGPDWIIVPPGRVFEDEDPGIRHVQVKFLPNPVVPGTIFALVRPSSLELGTQAVYENDAVENTSAPSCFVAHEQLTPPQPRHGI